MSKPQNRFIFRILLSVVIGGGLAAPIGCTKGPTEKQKSVLKVQLRSEPVSLDPAFVEDGIGLQLVSQLREGLVGYDAEGKLRNCLAESYQVSANGKRFEFKLKPDLKWSDGVPLHVKDFVFGIRRALSPKSSGKVSEQLMLIRGARDYRAGKSQSLGVKEENDKLVIELEAPAPYFLQVLTLPPALPVREDSLRETSNDWVEKKEPGTGAYRFAAYQRGRRLLLEANPYYWQGKPEIPLVDIVFVPEESTALNLFESGQLDIVTRVSAPDISRLEKQGVLRTAPFLATYYIAFNVRKPPFNDRELRRAVAGAIRRDEIVKSLGTGETPARSWIPKGLEGYSPYEDTSAVFADSLRHAHSRFSKTPQKPISAVFDSSERNSLIMEKIQHDLMERIGMRLSLDSLDWKSYIKTIQTDAPPIYRFGWLSPFSDPISHLTVFTTGDPNNYTGWSNAHYDDLVRQISRIAPGPVREGKIQLAQSILIDKEAVVVPIYHYTQNYLVSKRVKGFKANPFGVISFRDLSFSSGAEK